MSETAVALISIHVLRVEDDFPYFDGLAHKAKFQSTSSVWRTTNDASILVFSEEISIHVLRVEDDFKNSAVERLPFVFQSTSSVWRTTLLFLRLVQSWFISIHVLRVEDDADACSFV